MLRDRPRKRRRPRRGKGRGRHDIDAGKRDKTTIPPTTDTRPDLTPAEVYCLVRGRLAVLVLCKRSDGSILTRPYVVVTGPVTPARIEYRGPDGWRVIVLDDGIHLHSPQGDRLDPSEVAHLWDVVAHVREQLSAGTVPAPRPLEADDLKQLPAYERANYQAKIAARAVDRALSGRTPQNND